MFSGLKTGISIDKEELNQSIKRLYKTNYFELDALQYRQDPNLQFYDNQTYHFRVFIKES